MVLGFLFLTLGFVSKMFELVISPWEGFWSCSNWSFDLGKRFWSCSNSSFDLGINSKDVLISSYNIGIPQWAV